MCIRDSFKDLRHKFLMAPESQVCDISAMAEDAALSELELIPLPGHFFEMIGVRTPDQTVFLADCLSSRATLDKYKVSFIYDVSSYLQTLDRVIDVYKRQHIHIRILWYSHLLSSSIRFFISAIP